MFRIFNLNNFRQLPAFAGSNFIHTSSIDLKGHAKWQNIKKIKELKDKQKAAFISKQMRIIRIALQEGGGSADPLINSPLNNAINEALRKNVPKATITATLKKVTEEKDKSKIQRAIFDVRMYNKLLVIIAIYSDNLAFTRNQLSYPFKRHKVDNKSSRTAFLERGLISCIARPEVSAENFEDDCLSDAIESGAEEIEVHDIAERQVSFLCNPTDFVKVKTKLIALNYQVEHSERMFIPKPNTIVRLNSNELEDYEIFKDRLLAVDGFDEIYDNNVSEEE